MSYSKEQFLVPLKEWLRNAADYFESTAPNDDTIAQVVRFYQDWKGLGVDGIVGYNTAVSLGIERRKSKGFSDKIGVIANALREIGETRRSANFLNNAPAIFKACEELGVTDKRHVAYILATASLESLFAPIKEWRAKPGTYMRKVQDRYWLSGYYG